MKYDIHAPDDGSGRAVIKSEKGWVWARMPLDKAREMVKRLNDENPNKKEG
jgi:hypothetical protein